MLAIEATAFSGYDVLRQTDTARPPTTGLGSRGIGGALVTLPTIDLVYSFGEVGAASRQPIEDGPLGKVVPGGKIETTGGGCGFAVIIAGVVGCHSLDAGVES